MSNLDRDAEAAWEAANLDLLAEWFHPHSGYIGDGSSVRCRRCSAMVDCSDPDMRPRHIRECTKRVEARIDFVRTLAITVDALHFAVLAELSPHLRMLSEQMRLPPRPGDLVMEMSTIAKRDQDANRFGRLISYDRVPLEDPDWEVESDGPVPLVPTWRIRTPDGFEYTWTNARFVRVPEEMTR